MKRQAVTTSSTTTEVERFWAERAQQQRIANEALAHYLKLVQR